MITLTIQHVKTKATKVELFDSKDKAEKRLQSLETNSEKLKTGESRKKEYLVGYSFDTDSEKALIEQYLPEDRRMEGSR